MKLKIFYYLILIILIINILSQEEEDLGEKLNEEFDDFYNKKNITLTVNLTKQEKITVDDLESFIVFDSSKFDINEKIYFKLTADFFIEKNIYFEFIDELVYYGNHLSKANKYQAECTTKYVDEDEVKYCTIEKAPQYLGSYKGNYLILLFNCGGAVTIENIVKNYSVVKSVIVFLVVIIAISLGIFFLIYFCYYKKKKKYEEIDKSKNAGGQVNVSNSVNNNQQNQTIENNNNQEHNKRNSSINLKVYNNGIKNIDIDHSNASGINDNEGFSSSREINKPILSFNSPNKTNIINFNNTPKNNNTKISLFSRRFKKRTNTVISNGINILNKINETIKVNNDNMTQPDLYSNNLPKNNNNDNIVKSSFHNNFIQQNDINNNKTRNSIYNNFVKQNAQNKSIAKSSAFPVQNHNISLVDSNNNIARSSFYNINNALKKDNNDIISKSFDHNIKNEFQNNNDDYIIYPLLYDNNSSLNDSIDNSDNNDSLDDSSFINNNNTPQNDNQDIIVQSSIYDNNVPQNDNIDRIAQLSLYINNVPRIEDIDILDELSDNLGAPDSANILNLDHKS